MNPMLALLFSGVGTVELDEAPSAILVIPRMFLELLEVLDAFWNLFCQSEQSWARDSHESVRVCCIFVKDVC